MAPRPKILVVEPLAWLREAEGELLTRGGYHACLAVGVADALAQSQTCRHAAVLTRFKLADGTGPELIRKLHLELLLFPPVVGIAGREKSAQRLREAGAVAVIRQPFGEAELLKAVRDAIR